MLKRAAAVIILLILASAAVWQLLWPEEPSVGVEEGNKAPDFTLPLLDGTTASLSGYEGKKVIVNFWATWCGPCRKEIPELKKIAEKYEGDLVILAVNYTVSEANESTVQNFVKSNAMDFPVLLDRETDVLSDYKVFSYPTSYFLDENGVIKKIHRGIADQKTLEEFAQS
ncbi:redoxin domain-containing protein [Bacillus mangrovi]|uniref:Redoxin domain-containing protein n=1 Tax=Metabacillus mangrovi TaxID=1491830 RepID=A0A7X2S0U1_9BACI|nr:TlpA disulfide reductase family protein [Metabacillus mangrovi]MTH51843.1 redoxin domain-containing protein [Metabacillus mangrovi]